MPTLKQKLPSLGALVTFEAAARHLSFTAAAEELHVTQAAVSRQIKLLETALGECLFERQHRSLRLTASGQKLLDAVRIGLEHIAGTVSELRVSNPQGMLTLGATIAFASLWLNPRLVEFHKHYPDIDVRILATDRDIDLQTESVDLAFGCGDYGRAQGVEARYLFADEVFPICSAQYLRSHPPLETPADLLNHSLLHLDEEHWRHISWEATDWPVWLKSQGVTPTLRSRGMRINNYPLLVQAAVNGQGVALGWRHLVSDLIAQGALVQPLENSLLTERGYYLVASSIKAPSPEARLFRDWVLERL